MKPIDKAIGREYSDRTLKDLLALPLSRARLVGAKFSLILLYCFFLALLVLILGLASGSAVTLPGWSWRNFSQGVRLFLIAAALTIVLSTPVAFFACIGRGYLSPLGFVFLALVMAQIVAVTGYGPYFLWAVPAIFCKVADSASPPLSAVSYGLVLVTSTLGLISTLLWWRFADHT